VNQHLHSTELGGERYACARRAGSETGTVEREKFSRRQKGRKWRGTGCVHHAHGTEIYAGTVERGCQKRDIDSEERAEAVSDANGSVRAAQIMLAKGKVVGA